MTIPTDLRTSRIAALNDLCRTAPGLAGRWLMTPGIAALPAADQSAIRARIETFADFSTDNDPHGERDFGAFDHAGEKVFWKIDYYDQDLAGGSIDPADARVTRRVLTIMLASEYRR